ncbi:MAG TPA: lipase maturation factor family protein [Thermoanaerobaculia bacterium]|nr:lipase maturation factor family protein [Thermoanaerobaculia bacterium]
MTGLRTASPPDRPLVIFDGDCGFCRYWVERWRGRLDGRADFEPFQAAAARFPELPVDAFRRAVGLILPDGSAFFGAQAVFRALALRPGGGGPLAAYEGFPPFAAAANVLYRAVASHRGAATFATRAIWGRDPRPSTYAASRRLFVGILGAISLVAFVSLWVQVDGLIGARGITPAGDLLAAVRSELGGRAFRLLPSVFWLGASDGALHAGCAAGAVLSVLLAADVFPALCAFGCWALYLSFTAVGNEFLAFQWDALLVETLFLAIFLVDPRKLRGASRSAAPPSATAMFLFRILLFRLMFSSGVVKLASGDRAWHALTALRYHYETQPLPTWIGWWMHQMPGRIQTLSAVVMFAIELVAPFFLFAPRRLRNGALLAIALLQVLIAATGNYAFFNGLTLALCLLLVDDQTLRRGTGGASASRGTGWPKPVLATVAAVVLFLGAVHLAEALIPRAGLTGALASAASPAEPFRTVNGYGLFAVMTTTRPEIVVEGSDDGGAWKPYAFRWKPGDVGRRPAFVEPHQPRLDWQMWFAALSDLRQSPWFVAFVHRLLEGDRTVIRLLDSDPFAGRAPKFVRAELWEYRFTDTATRRRTGAWWTRSLVGEYLPPVSLEDFSR